MGQAHALRGRILGVLIRKCRLASGRTPEECAQFLNLEAGDIVAWEYGDSIPSLPQLELLSSFLNGGSDALNRDAAPPAAQQAEFVILRQRLIGALLCQKRRLGERSIEELSALTALDSALLREYEFGQVAIPLSHLTILAQSIGQEPSSFMHRQDSPNGPTPMDTLNANATSGASGSTHVGGPPSSDEHAALIRLAIAFRDIDRKTLRRVADALGALIKAGEEGQIHDRLM